MGTDSLYYIMDYSGNYYRTNQADQLVSVVSQQDAMVFTFAQANSRICVGKKAAFYCMIPIEDSEDETDAAECEEVSPAEEMGVNDMEKQENTGVEEYFSPIKELTYDELTEQVEKDVSSYDLSEIDWAEYLTHFTYLVEGLKVKYRLNYENSKKHFSNRLSCDVAIVCAVDVEMNAVKKTFKDKRIERISFDNDASDYYYLELDGKNRKIRVIIAQQREMGMAAATNLTQSIIYHFNSKLVVLL